MRSIKTASRFALCLLLIMQVSPFVTRSQASSTTVVKDARANLSSAKLWTQPRRREVELKLFFVNPNHPDWQNDCGGGEFVKRKTQATRRLADAALRLLFAGPTPEEKAKGMESIAPLGDYYLGVSIKRGVAIVNFRPGAEEHLHTGGPVCMQQAVLTPINKTLKQFRTIKSVDYAINGKIIEEWDA